MTDLVATRSPLAIRVAILEQENARLLKESTYWRQRSRQWERAAKDRADRRRVTRVDSHPPIDPFSERTDL